MSLPTAVFIAPAALCALAWLGIGALLPRRLVPEGELVAFLARVAFGAVTFGVVTFVVGRAGLYERWLLVAATLVLAVPGALALPALVRSVRIPSGRAVRVLLGAVALALLLDLVAAAVPPTSADALKYHLPVPERWLELGRIDEPFWNWQGFSPFGMEMLYAQGLALGGGEVAGAIGGIFAALAAAAVYGLARELGAGDALAASVATALFVLQGIVTWEATSIFVELALSFYVALAVWLVVARATDARGIAWTSFLCGAAAGTKLIGLLPAGIVLAGAALALGARRLPRLLPYLALPALAAAGAWYARNVLATGNPLYPLYFGGER